VGEELIKKIESSRAVSAPWIEGKTLGREKSHSGGKDYVFWKCSRGKNLNGSLPRYGGFLTETLEERSFVNLGRLL
jgi:hypothetical protein